MSIDDKKAVYYLGVAKKMKQLAEEAHPGDKEFAEDMFLLGLVHEIAEEFTDYPSFFNGVGESILSRNGYKYAKEVGNYKIGCCHYKSEALNILNTALLMTSFDGKEITVKEKFDEIAGSIMGVNSQEYDSYREMAFSLDIVPEGINLGMRGPDWDKGFNKE